MIAKRVGMEVEYMKTAIMFFGQEICSFVIVVVTVNGGIFIPQKPMQISAQNFKKLWTVKLKVHFYKI